MPPQSKLWRTQIWDEFERLARESDSKDLTDPHDVVETLRTAVSNRLRWAPGDVRMLKLAKSLSSVEGDNPHSPVRTLATPRHLPAINVSDDSPLSSNSRSPKRVTSAFADKDVVDTQWKLEALRARKETEQLRLSLQETAREVPITIPVQTRADKRDILYCLVEEVEKVVASGCLDHSEAQTFHFLAKEVGMFWRPQPGKCQVTVGQVYGWLLQKGVRRGARVDMKLGLMASQKSLLDVSEKNQAAPWLIVALHTLRDIHRLSTVDLPARFRDAPGIPGTNLLYSEFVSLAREFCKDIENGNALCEAIDCEKKGFICLADVELACETLFRKSTPDDMRCLRKFQKVCNLSFPDLSSLFHRFSHDNILRKDGFEALCMHVDKDISLRDCRTLWRLTAREELSLLSFRRMILEDHVVTFRNPDIYTAAIWPWIDRISTYKEVSSYIMQSVQENLKRMSRVQCGGNRQLLRQDTACSALPLQAMQDDASAIKIKYDCLCGQIAMLTDGIFHPAKIKNSERSQIKAMIKYGDDKSHLCDLVRGSICYSGIDSLYRALRLIVSWEQFQQQGTYVISFEDRVQQPLLGGYRDCQLMLRVDDHICELQLHLKDVFDAKSHHKGGHFVYEVTRKRNEGILLAAMLNCPDAARRLIKAKGNTNAVKDKNKLSALHYAGMHGQMEMIELLVQGDACVFGADDCGHLPMYRSALHKHWPAAQYLSEHLLQSSRKWHCTLLHQCTRLEKANVGNSIQSMLFSLVEFCPPEQLNLITMIIEFLTFCRKRTEESTNGAAREVRGRSVMLPLPLSLDMLLQCDSGGRTLIHMCANRREAPGTALRTLVDACEKYRVPISAKALCIDFYGRSALSIAETNVAVDAQIEMELLLATIRELMDIEIARRDLAFTHFKVGREKTLLADGRLSHNGVQSIEKALHGAAELITPAQCSSGTCLTDARLELENTLQRANKSAVLCRRLLHLSDMENAQEANAWSLERAIANGFSHEEASFIMTEVFEGATKVLDQRQIIQQNASICKSDGVSQLRGAFLKKVGDDVSLLCQLVSLNHGDSVGALTKEAFFELAPTAREEDWFSLPKLADGRANLGLLEQEEPPPGPRSDKGLAVATDSEKSNCLVHFIKVMEELLDFNSGCVDVFRLFDVRNEGRIHLIDVAELLVNTAANIEYICRLWDSGKDTLTYDEFKSSFVDPAFAPFLPDQIKEVTQCLLHLGISSSKEVVRFFKDPKDPERTDITYREFFQTITNTILCDGGIALHVLAMWPGHIPLDGALCAEKLLGCLWNVSDKCARTQANTLGVQYADGNVRKTANAEMENAAWIIQKRIRKFRARRNAEKPRPRRLMCSTGSPTLNQATKSEWSNRARLTTEEPLTDIGSGLKFEKSDSLKVGNEGHSMRFTNQGHSMRFTKFHSRHVENSVTTSPLFTLAEDSVCARAAELSQVYAHEESEPEKRLLLAFQRYDEDKKGVLDLAEFADALVSVGTAISVEECHELCVEMDLYTADGASVVYSQYIATL